MAEEKSTVFRQKSLDRISSPEELDKYVKTARPAVILLFINLIVFFIGIITWSFVGKVETKSTIGFNVLNGISTSYITEVDYEHFIKDKDLDKIILKFENYEAKISSISPIATQANATSDSYLLHAADISVGEWYYLVTGDFKQPINGTFKGKIVYDKVSPINFLY